MKLYIGFSNPKNKIFPIFSWLIKKIEKTPYSHVYVRWYSIGAQVDVCYHASGKNIHFLSKKVFEKEIEPVKEYEVEIDRESYRKLLKFCMMNAGKDYGFLQIIGIGLQRLFDLDKNPLSKGKSSQVCSELVGNIIEDVKGEDVEIDLDIAGPGDIEEHLIKNKHVYKRVL